MRTEWTPEEAQYIEAEGGDVASVLAELSGQPRDLLEQRLQTGITPWKLAKELNVLEAFRALLIERVLNRLHGMVQNRQISQQRADEMLALFQAGIGIPAMESEYTH